MSHAFPSLDGIPVVGISASPSEISSTARVLDDILHRFAARGARVEHIRLRDLPPAALVAADTGAAEIMSALGAVDRAAGVVFATPIYKAAYSGLLKLFIDLLPQFALAGKTVLPVATGGTLAHALALDYGLRPVLQAMGPRHIVQSLLVPSSSLKYDAHGIVLEEAIAIPLAEAIYHMQCSIVGDTTDRYLGHPRPERAISLP